MSRFTAAAAEKIAFAKAREARELAAANARTAATLAKLNHSHLVRAKCAEVKLPTWQAIDFYKNADAARVYATCAATAERIATRRYSEALA